MVVLVEQVEQQMAQEMLEPIMVAVAVVHIEQPEARLEAQELVAILLLQPL